MPVRFVLADDQFLVREGTAALLAGCPELELVGTAADLDELLTVVEDTEPDAVLTDIRMPPNYSREGIEAAHRLRERYPAMGVLVLSQYAEEDYAFALLSEGANGVGYLLKERIGDRAELVHALQTVAAGGSVLDPKIVEAVVRQQQPARSPLAMLTQREREVLEQMALGKSNAAIARALVVSERAVEKHINTMFAKLGLTEEPDVHRRVMAVLTLLRQP
jgi:DNA-binding NarL/FixJ family response regulator